MIRELSRLLFLPAWIQLRLLFSEICLRWALMLAPRLHPDTIALCFLLNTYFDPAGRQRLQDWIKGGCKDE